MNKVDTTMESTSKVIRSPFFYVGDKYKLIKQLRQLMPGDIDKYIEPFVGGGSSYLNSAGHSYHLNDINGYVINLHKALSSYAKDGERLFQTLYALVDYYGLSCSYLGRTVPEDLKKQYVKTYYAHYNKEAYLRMREDFNREKNNLLLLYLLLVYGFNHMIRFNGSGDFNLPCGNVDFNKNVYQALDSYLKFQNKNNITYYNQDYKDFLNALTIEKKDYVFLDPPYLISLSEYNRLWNEEKETELCAFLDVLDRKGVKWGITNLISHKGRRNKTFYDWSRQYLSYQIDSNYISFNDNSIKEDSKEVFVTNYEKD